MTTTMYRNLSSWRVLPMTTLTIQTHAVQLPTDSLHLSPDPRHAKLEHSGTLQEDNSGYTRNSRRVVRFQEWELWVEMDTSQ
jgi:hypothetical protein